MSSHVARLIQPLMPKLKSLGTNSVCDDLISHIGIAVADLEKSIRIYESVTGHTVGDITEVTDQKVRVAMFGGHESARIELVAATSSDSPIARFIAKNGEGLHHLCILVYDIEARLSEMKSKGFRLIDETPRIGAEGKKIAFVHPSSTGGVLIELQEKTT